MTTARVGGRKAGRAVGASPAGADESAPAPTSSPVPRIGLSLSGGGFRATAFGLGCMRALHDRGVLQQVSVVSGVSGGSLLAGLWAYGPKEFEAFEASAVEVMRGGLQSEIARHLVVPSWRPGPWPSLPRGRTEALIGALAAHPFGAKDMGEVTHAHLSTVISATDLTTTNAVRFGSVQSSCSPYGKIREQVTVAEAVASSAAFPLLLPALKRTYTFERGDGSTHRQDLLLTDGGVYDNLGLSALLPGRVQEFTSHVYELDYIVAVDAGRGRPHKVVRNLLPQRLMRSFDITYAKTQDGSRARLHSEAQHGALRGFVHAYLAMPDRRLPAPVDRLVPRESVIDYPTNFAAVEPEPLELLTRRGEQLTRALLDHYHPEL